MVLWVIAAAGAAVIGYSGFSVARKARLRRTQVGNFLVRIVAFVMLTQGVGYVGFMYGLLTDQHGYMLIGALVLVPSCIMLGRIERDAVRLGVLAG